MAYMQRASGRGASVGAEKELAPLQPASADDGKALLASRPPQRDRAVKAPMLPFDSALSPTLASDGFPGAPLSVATHGSGLPCSRSGAQPPFSAESASVRQNLNDLMLRGVQLTSPGALSISSAPTVSTAELGLASPRTAAASDLSALVGLGFRKFSSSSADAVDLLNGLSGPTLPPARPSRFRGTGGAGGGRQMDGEGEEGGGGSAEGGSGGSASAPASASASASAPAPRSSGRVPVKRHRPDEDEDSDEERRPRKGSKKPTGGHGAEGGGKKPGRKPAAAAAAAGEGGGGASDPVAPAPAPPPPAAAPAFAAGERPAKGSGHPNWITWVPGMSRYLGVSRGTGPNGKPTWFATVSLSTVNAKGAGPKRLGSHYALREKAEAYYQSRSLQYGIDPEAKYRKAWPGEAEGQRLEAEAGFDFISGFPISEMAPLFGEPAVAAARLRASEVLSGMYVHTPATLPSAAQPRAGYTGGPAAGRKRVKGGTDRTASALDADEEAGPGVTAAAASSPSAAMKGLRPYKARREAGQYITSKPQVRKPSSKASRAVVPEGGEATFPAWAEYPPAAEGGEGEAYGDFAVSSSSSVPAQPSSSRSGGAGAAAAAAAWAPSARGPGYPSFTPTQGLDDSGEATGELMGGGTGGEGEYGLYSTGALFTGGGAGEGLGFVQTATPRSGFSGAYRPAVGASARSAGLTPYGAAGYSYEQLVAHSFAVQAQQLFQAQAVAQGQGLQSFTGIAPPFGWAASAPRGPPGAGGITPAAGAPRPPAPAAPGPDSHPDDGSRARQDSGTSDLAAELAVFEGEGGSGGGGEEGGAPAVVTRGGSTLHSLALARAADATTPAPGAEAMHAHSAGPEGMPRPASRGPPPHGMLGRSGGGSDSFLAPFGRPAAPTARSYAQSPPAFIGDSPNQLNTSGGGGSSSAPHARSAGLHGESLGLGLAGVGLQIGASPP